MIKAECFQLLWSIIHKQALRATDSNRKRSFQHFIENLMLDFPCKKCQPHFVELCADVPMSRFEGSVHNGKDISCFYWSFHIHNLVNMRLNKNIYLIDEALEYHSRDSCEDCEIENANANVNGNHIQKKKNSKISGLLSS